MTMTNQNSLRNQLHTLLTRNLSLDELRTLCFSLGVDFDNLGAETKDGTARELIRYLERRDELERLIDIIKKLRPSVNIDGLQETGLSVSGLGLIDVLTDDTALQRFMDDAQKAIQEPLEAFRPINGYNQVLANEFIAFNTTMTALNNKARQGQLDQAKAQDILTNMQASIRGLTDALKKYDRDVKNALPRFIEARQNQTRAFENGIDILSPFVTTSIEIKNSLIELDTALNKYWQAFGGSLESLDSIQTSLGGLEKMSGKLDPRLKDAIRDVSRTLNKVIDQLKAGQDDMVRLRNLIKESLTSPTSTLDSLASLPPTGSTA